jgi:4-amino-4-deoxy-L-arabinose transferase-like glycosyltransferase
MNRLRASLKNFLYGNWVFFLVWAVIATALRAFFFLKYRMVTDDSVVYADIAKNWLQSGVYGQVYDRSPEPTYIRMPGYSFFIIAVWLVAGVEHYNAILIAQIAIDVLTCFVIADVARRIGSKRAAKVAFVLAALCPFFANYAVVPLTETLAIFFAALSFDLLVAAFDSPERFSLWVFAGLALGCGILLRPDGGILLAALAIYMAAVSIRNTSAQLARGAIVAIGLALCMLIPWTVRNWRAFHRFQPLTPFSANMPWEFVPHGFQRWSRTWIADYASLEDVWFKVDGTELTIADLPPRAYDTEEQRQRTDALFQAYVQNGVVMSPALDSAFNDLAAERIRTHPFRYYVILPLMRAADLWLRPRTEMLPIDPHWWRLSEDDPPQFWTAVLLGSLNLLYLIAAAVAMLKRQARYAGLFLLFALLRTPFLAWMPNPEPRYVLECYPAVLAIAACVLNPSTRSQQR